MTSGAGSGVNDETRFSSRDHWLTFADGRIVACCACGFRAVEDDEGYGDSVVDHIAEVAADAAVDTALAPVLALHAEVPNPWWEDGFDETDRFGPTECAHDFRKYPCPTVVAALRTELREGGSRG